MADATADTPYAPPTGPDFTQTDFRSWWKWFVVLGAAFSAGTIFAWVDATRSWSEVLRLMLPITIFGCAAAVICFLDSPEHRWRLLLFPVAAVAAVVVTGVFWELIGSALGRPRLAGIVVVLLAFSNLAGLLLIAGALVWCRRFSWRYGIRFAVLGALLGTLSITLVNTPTPSASRVSKAFLFMSCWQFVMLACVVKLPSKPTMAQTDEQELTPIYID